MEKTDSCWLWTASIGKKGYGRFVAVGEYYAHRVSWIIHKGQIPDELSVLHECDIRNCVNPNHLFLGTSSDNSQDMKRKGRGRGAYDEAHSRCKISTIGVNHIRKSTSSSTMLAAKYGVTKQHVDRIRSGKRRLGTPQ